MTERITAADATSVEVVDDDSQQPHEASPAQFAADGDVVTSDVALARTALGYLIATDSQAAELLPRAIRPVSESGDTRFEPATMIVVGGLVLPCCRPRSTGTVPRTAAGNCVSTSAPCGTARSPPFSAASSD
jgi:hypothetical protein